MPAALVRLGWGDVLAARKAILGGATVLDVGEPNEVQSGRIEGATHVPLGELEANLDKLAKDRPIVTYCGHGERAATAVSILEPPGGHDGPEDGRAAGAEVAGR